MSFSNLITITVTLVLDLGRCRWNAALFYWFQGRNLLGDYQNFKRGGDFKKGENQISNGKCFFLFYQSKILSHFVPVSADNALKKRSLG